MGKLVLDQVGLHFQDFIKDRSGHGAKAVPAHFVLRYSMRRIAAKIALSLIGRFELRALGRRIPQSRANVLEPVRA